MRNTGILLIAMLLFNSITIFGQQPDSENSNTTAGAEIKTFRMETGNSQFIVKGTSSLHDWEMVSDAFDASFKMSDLSGPQPQIELITINVRVNSLKSGNKVMDKKCHNALKEDDHPRITYKFKSVKSIQQQGQGTYKAVLSGTLTIAGKTKNVDIPVTLTEKQGKINIQGEKPLKMTDFDVEPPTALLGTIKTGNDITIQFNLNLL